MALFAYRPALAIALSALTAWPGVVDQDDLDATLVNALPAVGVALAAGLTIAARPRLEPAPRRELDPVRVALGDPFPARAGSFAGPAGLVVCAAVLYALSLRRPGGSGR